MEILWLLETCKISPFPMGIPQWTDIYGIFSMSDLSPTTAYFQLLTEVSLRKEHFEILRPVDPIHDPT
jgi:hypothetical protein